MAFDTLLIGFLDRPSHAGAGGVRPVTRRRAMLLPILGWLVVGAAHRANRPACVCAVMSRCCDDLALPLHRSDRMSAGGLRPAKVAQGLVLGAAAQLIPYALVADASPLGLAAALTVLGTGRLKALAFSLGVLAGQLLACAVLVLIGSATVGNRQAAHPTLQALLAVGFGAGLLVLAAVAQRRPEVSAPQPSKGRTRAALDRLSRVHAATAVTIGLLLGIGGPKRLVLTGLAAASIGASGTSDTQRVLLVGWYGIIATVVVWVPVLAYVVLGTRAVAKIDAGFSWFTRHRRPVTVYSLALVGAFLVAGGLAQL